MTYGPDEPISTLGESNGEGENDTVTCPKCGDDFGNLPNHLPACDGGDDE